MSGPDPACCGLHGPVCGRCDGCHVCLLEEDGEVPCVDLTRARVGELLRQGTQGARELREALEKSHLQGYSQAMSTRLR